MAWWILEESTGLSRTQLQFGHKDTTNIPNLQEIIGRLRTFEPIQYIFGHTLWYGLDLKVTSDTLIPRPETAELVERVVHDMAEKRTQPLRVLDIGTGSGCIALAIKQSCPDWHVSGLDVSPEAVRVATENARSNRLNVDFFVADVLSPSALLEQYDVVVSNPPYICPSEKRDMRRNVLDYEPDRALFVPEDDPLLFYRAIAERHLAPTVCFEINQAFPAETASMMHDLGYLETHVYTDMYGKSRILVGRSHQQG